jgi:Ser/Thr protein kinase RdoA (MazF antagonist)
VELALSHWLAERGVDSPPVAAARARKAPLFGHELALATRRIVGARDLESQLVLVRTGRAARAGLRGALRAFGALVARLHAIGFVHADLTPKNVLVEARADARPRLWLIDLDRSRVVPHLSEDARLANLGRLWRFVERRERRDGRALTAADVARFLAEYEPQRARRRELWRAVAREHARASAWHRIGWALDRAQR